MLIIPIDMDCPLKKKVLSKAFSKGVEWNNEKLKRKKPENTKRFEF